MVPQASIAKIHLDVKVSQKISTKNWIRNISNTENPSERAADSDVNRQTALTISSNRTTIDGGQRGKTRGVASSVKTSGRNYTDIRTSIYQKAKVAHTVADEQAVTTGGRARKAGGHQFLAGPFPENLHGDRHLRAFVP